VQGHAGATVRPAGLALAPAPAAFRPEPGAVASSQLSAFVRYCERATGSRFAGHQAFHEFSVAELRRFWGLFLEWSGLVFEGSPERVCTDERCEHATFFPDVRLSYVENLLRIDSPADGERTALTAHRPWGAPERMTRRELRDAVRAVANRLHTMGVKPGDRVAAIAGNNAEVVVGALAAAAVGATFSCASPDMGPAAALSRFEQLAPTVLMANLHGGAEAASVALSDRVAEVVRGLPTVRALVALDDGPVPKGVDTQVHRIAELIGDGAGEGDAEWPRFPFNHPLFVLFSSGTTGRPKCIVHGAGGTLLEHAKEQRLHVDLGLGDSLFFHTSTAWMMWNWQLSALACGSEIVLFDGPLAGSDTLWRLVSAHDVSVFGTSPPYLQLCEDAGFSPRREMSLRALRAVLSTGSILHDWQYDWVREHVGSLPLQSISGGTDIVGCFVLGNPNLPVHRGWIQCRSLGMDVQAQASDDTPSGSAVGELVCRTPFPSRPLGFLGDDEGARFHDAYFSQNEGVWTHGDLIEFDSDGQARLHGRSDGVLKVQGIRVGPADIYRALHGVTEVRETMAVEQAVPGARGSSRIVLLVVLEEGAQLDGRLTVHIRSEIGRHASPLHVPELVVQVDELPTTHSGKRSERAARDAVAGVPAINAGALRNAGAVDRIHEAVGAADQERRELAGAPEPGDDTSTEARVRAIWESVLGVAPLRPDDNFFDVGGTSLAALRVNQLVRERLGVELPLSTVIYAQTTSAMAAVIEGPIEQRVRSLVLLRPGTGDRPLFFAHSLTGDALEMRALALRLQVDRPVYGLQARGLDPREQPQRRVEEMAETCIETMRTVQPRGPYSIGGYSFGGLVAFEIARRLSAGGEQVEWLAMVDVAVSHRCLPWRSRWRFLVARPFRVLRAGLAAPRTRLPRYVRHAAWRLGGRSLIAPPAPRWGTLPPRQRRLEELGWEAMEAYRPEPYAGSAILFGAAEGRPHLCDSALVWQRVVEGGLTVETLPGDHFQALQEGQLELIARRMSASLAGQ
jgi:acetoacetyl-CoA synthetase